MNARIRTNILILCCLLVGLFIPISISFISLSSIKKINSVSQILNTNKRTEDEIKQLLYSILLAESSQRGYCISGDKSFLKNYTSAKNDVQNHLKNISADLDSLNISYIAEIQTLVNQKMNFISDVILTFEKKGLAVAQAEVSEGKGKVLTLDIISLADKIKINLNARNTLLTTDLNLLKDEDEFYDYLGSASAVLIFLFAGFIIFRNIYNRNKFERELLLSREKLIESEKRFMSVFYHNPASNLYSEFDTRAIKDVNESYLKLVGYNKDELINNPAAQAVMNVNERDALRIRNELKINGYVQEIETTLTTKGGEIKNIMVSGTMLNGLDGKEYVLYHLNDITQQRFFESQLLAAKLHAENSANVKEQFLANMSHEIRTPLNAIIGFSNLLSKTVLNEKQETYIKAIKTSSNNLLNITNDILDYSKLEAGMFKIEKISFNLKALVNSVFTMFVDKAEEKKLKYLCEIEDSIPTFLLGDPTRLTQILINLIGNAFKFTSDGSVSLSVKSQKLNESNVRMEFLVKDSGIGIENEHLEKIFERFNQAEEKITRNYGGTGLGLAIVKRLVELQAGTISVESKIRKGTSFIFTLDYEILNNLSELASNNNSDEFVYEIKNKRILVVEDNNLNQLLAQELLSSYGLEVIIADNGQIAIEILSNQTFDLILMDLQMPIMDGYKTTEHIRKIMKLRTPIIAMSAHVLVAEKEKCLSSGMNNFLTKPFKEEDFKRILKNYLQNISDQNGAEIKREVEDLPDTVIDLNSVIKMSKGKQEFVQRMIFLYLNDTPIEIDKLNKAIVEADFVLIQAVSHKIKSSIGIIGFCNEGINLMESIEREATNKININEIEESHNCFKVLFDRSVIELNTFLSSQTKK